MEALIDEILNKLHHLSESRLREVLHFVDVLSQPERNSERITLLEKPLLLIVGTLSGEPLSSNEIEAELYGE